MAVQLFQISQPISTLSISGVTIAWDLSVKQTSSIILTTNAALSNPTNALAGNYYTLIVIQDNTGSRTLTFGTNYKWANGTVPVLSTIANSIDVLTFIYNGTYMLGCFQKGFV
jgi:hypothetical protein